MIVSRSHVLTIVGALLLVMTAGIESLAAEALSYELIAPTQRLKAFYQIINFSNLGSLLLAILSMLLPASIPWRRPMLSAVPILIAIASMLLRHLHLPESPDWRAKEAAKFPWRLRARAIFRLVIGILFSYSNATGFALMTYALGLFLAPTLFSYFLLVSAAGAFSVGLLSPLFSRLPLARLLVLSYATALGFAVILGIKPTTHFLPWIGLAMSTSVAFLAENAFKTSIWPSRVRGRMLAWERASGQLGYAATIVIMPRTSLPAFLHSLIAIWIVGLVAAILWAIAPRRAVPH